MPTPEPATPIANGTTTSWAASQFAPRTSVPTAEGRRTITTPQAMATNARSTARTTAKRMQARIGAPEERDSLWNGDQANALIQDVQWTQEDSASAEGPRRGEPGHRPESNQEQSRCDHRRGELADVSRDDVDVFAQPGWRSQRARPDASLDQPEHAGDRRGATQADKVR